MAFCFYATCLVSPFGFECVLLRTSSRHPLTGMLLLLVNVSRRNRWVRYFHPIVNAHAGHTPKKAAPGLETAFAVLLNMFYIIKSLPAYPRGSLRT